MDRGAIAIGIVATMIVLRETAVVHAVRTYVDCSLALVFPWLMYGRDGT